MARTIQQIYDEMVAEGNRLATEQSNDDAIEMFAKTSVVALWKIMFYVMAFCVWGLEVIQDAFYASVNDTIATLVPHTARWYRTKGLAFQYGFDLIADTDTFDNTGKTAQQIADSLIVKYCAVNETTVDGKRTLLVKVATLVDGQLAPLSDLQFAAFQAYMAEIKDAGVYVIFYNRLADIITAEVDFYYNALLLDDEGNRLDGLGGNPVEAAGQNFLLNLPFNGEFSNAQFIDALQEAYGASDKDVFLVSLFRKTGEGEFESVRNTFIPDAGYVRFDTDGFKINYYAHLSN